MSGKVFEIPKVIISAAVTCLEVLALSRDLLTTLTIVNAKDSLFLIRGKFRSIVDFPAARGYTQVQVY